MKFIGKLILKGLTALLPISITIYVIYWLVTSTESFLGKAIKLVLPEHQYWPGMGLIAGLVILILVGAFINAFAIQALTKIGEGLLEKIPLVKNVSQSIFISAVK